MALILGSFAALAWLGLLLAPFRPYATRERIVVTNSSRERDAAVVDLSNLAVIIPARNEAEHIPATLSALAAQGRGLAVLLVDDQSEDSTAAIAGAAAARYAGSIGLEVISGVPLPSGWGGKLWALEQGLQHVQRPWVLLLDADIEIEPGLIVSLLAKARDSDSVLVSVMAQLRCESVWERLLVPPFIYFFKLIYPFDAVNNAKSRFAAAAGGCILVRRDVLQGVGAFEAMRDALIDDCTLARRVKQSGGRIWLGLSHSVLSRRQYNSFSTFAEMITRTAFTQLNYSLSLLLLVTALMFAVFAGPFIVIWNHPDITGVSVGVVGLLAMLIAYLPVQRWYAMRLPWVLTLPVAALVYLVMTWQSAIIYWRGIRASWKGRAYASR